MINTERWNVTSNNDERKTVIEEAVAVLKAGDTVAFPTETVYGLGADATNEIAVAKIFKAKGRPQDNPLIAHVATKDQLKQLTTTYPQYVDKLIDHFAPGPITFVLPSNGVCAKNVTAGLDTVGIRIPNHPVAQHLLQQANLPLAAPSANLSGKPSPTTADHVWDDLNGKIAGLLDDGPTGVGVESTVVDCTGEVPMILRPGGVTKEQLEEVVGKLAQDSAIVDKLDKPKSPGMKYRHYSPELPLLLVEGDTAYMQKQINLKRETYGRVGVLASNRMAKQLTADEIIPLGDHINDIASHLYDGLRTFKQGHVNIILCEAFEKKEIGVAVMNRLEKAASSYLKEK